MRTTMSVAVLLLTLVVLAPQNVLAAGWGGGVSVPGWGPWDSRDRSSPYWGNGYGGYSYAPVSVSSYSPAVPCQLARVVNPSTNHASLTFWVNDQRFVLAPGMQQEVRFAPGQAIQFDRGVGRETVRYRLEDATFAFSPTAAGWELYRTSPETVAATAAQPARR